MGKNIVFFDGECNFCNSTVDFIWNHNRARDIYYSSLQSDFARSYLTEKGVESIDLDTIYFSLDGTIYNKTKAFIKILNHLSPRYKFLGGILYCTPIFFSNIVYDFIAGNRYRILGKKESCRIPTAEERNYFIL